MSSAEPPPVDPSSEGRNPETSTRLPRRESQLDFELEFLGRILDRDPCYIEVLRVHANNLSAKKHLTRALLVDRRLVRLLPERPIPWYNLACSYALLGMVDPAFGALQRAVELGYPRLDHMAKDPDLRPLRRDRRFSRLLRKSLRALDDE